MKLRYLDRLSLGLYFRKPMVGITGKSVPIPKAQTKVQKITRATVVAFLGFSFTLAASCGPPSPPNPTPTPPPPGTCCHVADPRDPGWHVADKIEPPYNALLLNEAEETVGDACGKSPQESMTKLTAELAARGVCGGEWDGTMIVLRPDGLWEQWNVIGQGGCWNLQAPENYLGTWRGPGMECK